MGARGRSGRHHGLRRDVRARERQDAPPFDGPKRKTRKFVLTYIVALLIGFAIVCAGANPVLIVEFAVPLSAIGLPMSYLATLLVARDDGYMGDTANGVLANSPGWLYLAVSVVLAVVAIPLLILSNHGTL